MMSTMCTTRRSPGSAPWIATGPVSGWTIGVAPEEEGRGGRDGEGGGRAGGELAGARRVERLPAAGARAIALDEPEARLPPRVLRDPAYVADGAAARLVGHGQRGAGG